MVTKYYIRQRLPKLVHLFKGYRGWINNRLALGLIFYLIITPIAIVMRVFGRDALNRKIDKDSDSYWIKSSSVESIKEHCERQF